MYIDFAEISEHDDAFDVCIIGAGAAGISMAVTLAERGHRVLLCEGAMQTIANARSSAIKATSWATPTFLSMALACAF